MTALSFFVLLLVVNVESLTCPTGQESCGLVGCYDPATQGCTNDDFIIQCINSCNGTCYSNSQYCYNNTKVCNIGELVCDIKTNGSFSPFPLGLTCYNSSSFICSRDMLCNLWFTCGEQCLNDTHSVCANDNRTICYGSHSWSGDLYVRGYVDVCGPENQCYDTRTSICLGGITICEGLHASLCGGSCFNPEKQTCINNTIQCIHSCNGTCFSNTQYCNNDTKVCDNDELVCDVKMNSSLSPFPLGLTCYDPTQFTCSDNTLCDRWYACGTKCLNDSNSVCANDRRTICHGSQKWSGDLYVRGYIDVCGPEQQCYNIRTSVCLGGITLCDGLNARFCGGKCFDPNTQTCIAGNIQCINSCNGTCYSNSQYCYNNTKVCDNGELVCDVKSNNSFTSSPLGLVCYNHDEFICSRGTLCYPRYTCGGQCLNDTYSACANDNRTICYGFSYWSYSWYENIYLHVCGLENQCYDNRTSVCMNNNGTVCPIDSQLCSGSCYNPQSQYCVGVNSSIHCLSDPSSSNCPSSTSRTTITTTRSTNSSTFPWTIDCSNNNLPKLFLCIFLITCNLINKFCF